ncbi:energy coupling factor transporter S component ThiW [Streptococcus zalophi]|uniref:Energy coupling factor transporter S component ThiW n=1 Tax=Streptococcus zalophi TaxID=640031 RepID=A0A934PAS2_9STRE|nr:energy coupling factor transporter S component ThiW [Streptococcus zalophi]MBJ8350008.1 energy coupling factor transporter S component ThiW [Streptococcus zalophi]MCR8967014.1 energy coupling factor transporter S component ThiW [Streptococcus zalophi]
MVNQKTTKLSVLAIMIALDVFLSPIFRIEGMAFMSSVVNVIAGILMGPIFALIMALITAVIRILTQSGVAAVAPLAILGAGPGAFLAGVCYRLWKKDWASWLGEFIGTGLIGSILSAPVMVWYWTFSAQGDSELLAKASAAQSLFLFTPRFVGATIIGGIIGMFLVQGLKRLPLFTRLQTIFIS